MKKICSILIILTLFGCSSSQPNHDIPAPEITELPKNVEQKQTEVVEEKQTEDGWIAEDKVPIEVYTYTTDIVSQLEENSGVTFKLNDFSIRTDEQVGKSYEVMYYATSYESNKAGLGGKAIQLRLLFDFDDYKLNDICIIAPVEKPSELISNIYYNQVWPAFLEFDFPTLFENRLYRRTKLSDDDTHSQNLHYTEYILDLTNGLLD